MSEKQKIYITSLHLKHGGVEMAITLLANALSRCGYEVEILCIYNLGEPAYEFEDKVKVTYLSSVKPNREAFVEAVHQKQFFEIIKEGIIACKVLYIKRHVMIQAIKNIHEGTVISTRNEHSVLLSKYGDEKVRKIAQLHHDHAFHRRLLNDFKYRYDNIDYFVLLTDLLKEEIGQIMEKNTHTKLEVVPNFLPEISEKVSVGRKNQIIAVGRLHEVKGFLRLLDVWKNFNKRGMVLKIVGEGEQRKEIEAYISELKLEDSVILTGALDHEKVLMEMQQSKVYVMTSKTEAFPFVLIEAMSSGLPVIAYDVRVGPAAIIHDNRDGYLVPDGDEKIFIDRLERLLMDDKKWHEMSQKAQETAQQFSEKNVMKKWIKILEG